MAVIQKPDTHGVFDAHRLEMMELMRQIDSEAGIPDEPECGLAELHERMLASGVRPEDNVFSREILRMRYDDAGSE